MLLKEAQDLLCGRDLLTIEHTTGCLGDPLLHQPKEVLEVLQQSPSPNIVLLPQHSDDPLRLITARLGDGDELLVGLFELLTSFLALFTSDPVQLLAYAPHAAIASAKNLLVQATSNLGRQRLLRSPCPGERAPLPRLPTRRCRWDGGCWSRLPSNPPSASSHGSPSANGPARRRVR